jgi:hypothetical protein
MATNRADTLDPACFVLAGSTEKSSFLFLTGGKSDSFFKQSAAK